MVTPHFSNELKHTELLHSLEDITQNIFFKIEDTKYTQGCMYVKKTFALNKYNFHLHQLLHNKRVNVEQHSPNNNSNRPKQNKPVFVDQQSKATKQNTCGVQNEPTTSLLKIFLNNLDPINYLSSTNNEKNAFCLNLKRELDTFAHLLKQITPRHKCLRRKIESYVELSTHNYNDSAEDDVSYVDGEYMLFWCCLLDCTLIVVDTVLNSDYVSTFRKYEPLWEGHERSVLVIERQSATRNGFTSLIVNDVKEYLTQLERRDIYEWCDIKNIKKMKLEELQELCKAKYKQIQLVDNGKNLKKSEIVDQFLRLFKN